MPKSDFNKVEIAEIVFPEHLFQRTPLKGYV